MCGGGNFYDTQRKNQPPPGGDDRKRAGPGGPRRGGRKPGCRQAPPLTAQPPRLPRPPARAGGGPHGGAGRGDEKDRVKGAVAPGLSFFCLAFWGAFGARGGKWDGVGSRSGGGGGGDVFWGRRGGRDSGAGRVAEVYFYFVFFRGWKGGHFGPAGGNGPGGPCQRVGRVFGPAGCLELGGGGAGGGGADTKPWDWGFTNFFILFPTPLWAQVPM